MPESTCMRMPHATIRRGMEDKQARVSEKVLTCTFYLFVESWNDESHPSPRQPPSYTMGLRITSGAHQA